MSITDSLKEQAARDPVIKVFRRLFFRKSSTPEEMAYWHFKQARSFINYRNNKFDLGSAIFHLKEALRITPNNAYFHCEFGRILLLAPSFAVICGDNGGLSLSRCAEMSIESLQKSINIEPQLSWAYYHMAVGYEYIGQRDKAKEVCKKALSKLNKSEATSLIENYLKMLDEPVPDRETMKKLEQESLNHLKQALANQRKGKRNLAIKEFEAGCKLAPDSSWLYHNLLKLSSKKANYNSDNL